MIDLDFYQELEGALGGYLVDVELTEDDYIRAFNQAKRMYKQKGNNNYRHKYSDLNVTTGVRNYPVDPSINEIIKIIKPGGLYTDNPFTIAAIQDMFNGVRSDSGLATYELTSQMIENIEIYTAHFTNFSFDRLNHTIELWDTPKTDETWILEVYVDLTDDEYRDVVWIYEWTLAELKITLGRAYSKFSTVGGPTGETSLNGDQLIQEGREDKDRLLEDIKNHVDGDMVGLPLLIG